MINHEQAPYLSLRDSISSLFNRQSNKQEFWALNDVNFNVEQGDTIGIIGRNGAGKSTLLKILSKITPPTSGKIVCRGRIASLLEVGTGFHLELSGRENVFMNGSILGMRRAEILKNFDAIVDFAGVDKFIDTPLKHYSSGMQLRLAFAVAAFLENEILIIDEVLAVGDAEFQKKCIGKMEDVSKSGRTILFVTHDMQSLRLLCNKCALMKKGSIGNFDKTDLIINEYLNNKNAENKYINTNTNTNKEAFFKQIHLTDVNGSPKNTFNHDEEIIVNFEININNNIIPKNINVFITVIDQFKRPITSAETNGITSFIKLSINSNFLVRGEYSIVTFIHTPQVQQLHHLYDICPFKIIDNGSKFLIHQDYNYGSIFLNGNWTHNN